MIKKREGKKNVATLSLQEYQKLYLYCWQCTGAETGLPPLGAIEGHNWFFLISSQWESQKNWSAFISFGKIHTQHLRSATHDIPPLRHEREISNLVERDKSKPVRLRLSLVEKLEKPLMSLLGTEWRERSHGIFKIKRYSKKYTFYFQF